MILCRSSNGSRLSTLLADTAVVKFLHAGSEDLEVFLNAFKTLPTPMVDTQITAALPAGRSPVWLRDAGGGVHEG